MVLDSESLSIEGIIHWVDKLWGFSAGEAALDGAAEDRTLCLPTGQV